MTVDAPNSETVAYNLGIAAEMHRVVRALEGARVPAIVLKGIPLCERIGEGLGRRPIADNDILVRRGDVGRAKSVLETLGYRSLSWRSVEQDLEQVFEHPMSRPDVDGRPLFCELHWNAFPPSLFNATESILWERTVEVEVLGGRVRVFEPALQLLHLVSHALQHELCEPRTLEVFGLAWTRWHAEVDPAELIELANEIGIATALEYLIEITRALGLTKAEGGRSISRRVAVARRLIRPRRLLEPAEDRYPERYFRALLVLLLAPPARALGHLMGRVLPPPELPVRRRGRLAVSLHYLSRPWRPIARTVASATGLRRVVAAREYILLHRSLTDRYATAALDTLLGELESEPKASRPLPIRELAGAIRLAEQVAPRLNATPNTCLFRALSRYALLSAHSHPASFVLGVATRSDEPGHAWVELAGQPFLESAPPSFTRILTRANQAAKG